MSSTESTNSSKEKRLPAVIPLLPPTGISKADLIPELTAAHAAIGELRGFIGTIPNPNLLIAPFRKREAVASSAIEGTRATIDEVMAFEATDADRSASKEDTSKVLDIQEILNYERAMTTALKELITRPIGENLLKTTHATLLKSVRGSSKTPGEFRRVPVAVGDFLPPAYPEIPNLISNWEKYLNSDLEPDPLIRIGVAHYQFEAIHPFLDGNGRIGRLIIPLALCQEKMLQTPVLYISHYLEQYKVEYQRLLHEVDLEQNWTAWLKFFLRAVEAQAKITTAMAKEVQNLYERLKTDGAGKIRSRYTVPLLDHIFRQPVISAVTAQKIIKASKQTTYNLLKRFVEAGILKPYFVLGKEQYYEFTALRKIIRS